MIKIAFAGGGELTGTGLNTILTVGLEETTFGTASAAEIWCGVVDECAFGKEYMIYETVGIRNVRTLNSQTAVSVRYPFTIRGQVDSGIALAMALGYISGTTDPTLSIFKGSEHPTPTKSYLPSWTLRRTYDEATDDDVSLLGATVGSADFNIDLDGAFTFSLEGVAKSSGTDMATAQTSPSTVFGSWNTTVKVKEGADAYDGSGAVTVDGLRNIGFSINHNLRVRNEWGSAPASIRQPTLGPANLDLRITRGFIDDDFWDDLCDGTVQSFQVLCNDGTNSLTIELDSCFNRDVTHTGNMDDQSDEVATFSVKTLDCDVADSLTYVAYD